MRRISKGVKGSPDGPRIRKEAKRDVASMKSRSRLTFGVAGATAKLEVVSSQQGRYRQDVSRLTSRKLASYCRSAGLPYLHYRKTLEMQPVRALAPRLYLAVFPQKKG